MRVCGRFGWALAAGLLAATSTLAQLQLPQIFQLPDDDFTEIWGENVSIDNRSRPDFKLTGVEQQFRCDLTGAFRPGSRMTDFYNLRQFEQTLGTTIDFIQVAVRSLNSLYLSNDLDWAILECVIPQSTETERQLLERVDKAVERAERQRERRREREEDADE